MASVHTVVDGAAHDGDAALDRSAGAHGQNETGILVAHHGSSVIGRVVGRGAGGLAGRAVDGDAARVAGVVLHRRDNLHTTRREGVAVDVGQVVRDLAVGPGKLKLRDGARRGGIGGELDRDTDTLLAVPLRVAALEFLHAGIVVAGHRRVVDGVSTVVDDGGRSEGQDGGSRGKQHGCASDEVFELHFGWMFLWYKDSLVARTECCRIEDEKEWSCIGCTSTMVLSAKE